MHPLFYIGAVLALLAPPAGAADEHPVRARLLAERSAVEPGGSVRLGVELRMAEGWHTYWAYSGDAGMPTEVAWELPPGVAAGPLQWPLPEKYEEEGGLVVYGYADETMLLSELSAADSLEIGDTLHIGAEVSWLVCRELCIPGGAHLRLDLPVGRGQPRHGDLFARYAAQVPAPLGDEVALDYSVRATAGAQRIAVRLAARAGALRRDAEVPDFFPLGVEDFAFHSERLDGDALELTLHPYGGGAPAGQLRGVLVYGLAGETERRAGEVVLELKDAAPGGLLEADFGHLRNERPLWLYVLFAFAGGLILNLMPCVLPVISLKVLSIVNQAGAARGRVRALGLSFAAGIVATFAALALVVVLIKEGGTHIGWGFQFQYPGFVAAMAALIFALGLSLFGVFTINLPGVSGSFSASRGEGLTSSFSNGVLATVLATPCTAPLLGTALGFAFAQAAPLVFAIFLSIGLGMALPYVLLALRPGWTRFLPRPGAWMERFKQGMGFLLMATVLWLLWVLGKQVGAEGVVWTGAFLLGVALACWIVGQWLDLRASARRRRAVWALALGVVAASYVVFLSPVWSQERAYRRAGPAEEGGLEWIAFSPAEVERRVAAGQTVFIDFTAEWCWTCKVNERVVLSQPALRDRFAADGVALVRADWTDRNEEIARLLRAFGRSGVPLYVIFPGGRLDAPLVLPEIITVDLVLEKLDAAAAMKRGASRN